MTYEICKHGSVGDLKIEIAKLQHFHTTTVGFHHAFNIACEYGNINIVEYMISMGPDRDTLESGLYNASVGGHINVIELLIKNGATHLYNGIVGCDKCMNKNSIQKRMRIIELLLYHGAKPYAMSSEYYKYKLAQGLKFTKLHESLVDFVLSH